ncbi:hypothetical protein HPP92_011502 [Vanilla planifolia]|uniref:Uncharacterized protein n=1 Tax=Vanilla planifolia TaxID=51239 RepID=A0A835R4B2_VANPL|nr:hypothetical protein HPP92_011502 [Vanilla planifolia]
MDRLVKVEAAEIELNFRRSERCSASFKITSLIHTMPVAVKLSTTRSTAYSFSPDSVTLLLPLSSAIFTLVLLPTMEPPLVSPPDQVLVAAAVAPALHRANSAALRRFFSRPALHLFRDASLPIHLLGSQSLRSLLPLLPSFASSLLLTRIIPSCSPEEISNVLLLAAASGGGCNVAVSALLASGADPDSRNADGKSAISLAVSSGNAEAVKALIEAGARERPFHEAAAGNSVDLIHLLLGPSQVNWANQTDIKGRTPVHAAAAGGSLDALHLCLTSGGEPDRADVGGWTPLHYAASGGHLSAAELLIEASSLDPRRVLTRKSSGDGRKTPMDLAVENGHLELYELLRPRGEVIRAARSGDVVAVIKATGGVGESDQNGWTALHVAAFKGRAEAVRELLERGAEVEAVDDEGYTPLRCALEAGHTEVALLLVGSGARAGLKGLVKADVGIHRGAMAFWESCAAAVSAALKVNGICAEEQNRGIEKLVQMSAAVCNGLCI